MTDPLNKKILRVGYMITRLHNWAQLCLYSTRTLFHQYCMARKYR